MRKLTLWGAFQKKQYIVNEIIAGRIFIYPTDTVYGIGCNAYTEKAVEKIFEIKKRKTNKPVSVIAPSFGWIEQNCIMDPKVRGYLPGPYTVILEKKPGCKLPSIVSNINKIGVRIPNHKFTNFISQANVPFVTTSANISGEKIPTSVYQIPEEIWDAVDYILDDGKLSFKPSTVIDLTTDEVLRD